MARAGHEEITLPWRETVDGAVAEMGAIFRVELVGGHWQCSVKSGRCRTVIAKGLPSQREGKRRAQAHAATMPEVRQATRRTTKDAKPAAKKTTSRRAKGSDAQPDEAGEPASPCRTRERGGAATTEPAPAGSAATSEPVPAAAPPAASSVMTTQGVTYRKMEDGCLCGKTQGACWVANDGEVVFAVPPPQAVQEQVQAAVAQHYAAEKAAREAAAEKAAQDEKKAQASASRAARATAKKAAVKKIARAPKRASSAPAPKTKPARKAKPAKDAEPARERKPAATAAKVRKAARGRASKRRAAKEEAPVTVKAEATGRAPKRKAAALPTDAPTGPIAWSEVEGKPRGVAAHGTFLIEPEGQGFALYFADASGQSRHLRSGTMPELRRAAEEYAARGEPAPMHDAPSREQDEALMRIFASGAVEGA
jgi:hypothetical protein